MKVPASILFSHIISLAIAGVVIPAAKIIEGPSSKTTLVGPDGSVITSVAQGAKIVANENIALVAGPDTLALLKSADAVKIIDPDLEPVVTGPSTVIESHILVPFSVAEKNSVEQQVAMTSIPGHPSLLFVQKK